MLYYSIIEKKKKLFNGLTEHPHDWAVLIMQCEKTNPMKIPEMNTEVF